MSETGTAFEMGFLVCQQICLGVYSGFPLAEVNLTSSAMRIDPPFAVPPDHLLQRLQSQHDGSMEGHL
jgi:hypothetical protein